MEIKKCEKCENRKTCDPFLSLKKVGDEIKKRIDDPQGLCLDDIKEAKLQLILEMEKIALKTLSENCKWT